MANLTNSIETISETLRQNITFSTQEPHYLKKNRKTKNNFINNLLSIIKSQRTCLIKVIWVKYLKNHVALYISN